MTRSPLRAGSRTRQRIRLLALVVLCLVALYRTFVSMPVGMDGYLLYLPGITCLALYLPLAISCFSKKWDRVAILTTATLVTFGFLFPLRWNGPQTRRESLRVVSANLETWNTDMAEASFKLATLNPDILCLQEVWTWEGIDMLRAQFPNHRFFGDGVDMVGAKWPEHGVFVGVRTRLNPRGLTSPLDTTCVVMDLPSQPVMLVSLHGKKVHAYTPIAVLSTAELQSRQAEEILSLQNQYGIECVIGGDFNSPGSGPGIKVLNGKFHSAFKQAGRGFGLTFPTRAPFMRIDHVLGTEGVRFLNYTTIDVGSDHRAQVVDFVFDISVRSTPSSPRGSEG